jgi:hypothetical protein
MKEAGEKIIPHEGFRPHCAFYGVSGEIPARPVQLVWRGELLLGDKRNRANHARRTFENSVR